MLSKLLKDPNQEVRPLALGMGVGSKRAAGASKGGTSASAQEDSSEATQLRAQLVELASEADRRSHEAYEAGLRAGESAATKALEAEVRKVIERLTATITEIAGARADTIRRAESDTVKLAIEIARRVLHRELSVDTSALESLIKAALEKLQSQEVYRVRVHPDQELLVRSCLDQMGRGSAVAVISDPIQARGGAIFEISRGTLDASVDTQLSEIERGLTGQLDARP